MATYRFTLAFQGVDPWDDDLIEILAERLPRLHWGEVDGEVRAEVFADAPSGMRAVLETVAAVKRVRLGAKPLRVIEDFVSTSNIADRTGMSREAVRLWTLGRRGPGGFPPPRGTVGDGIRIWDWASVNGWLRRHYELGNVEEHLVSSEIARLNDLFATTGGSTRTDGMHARPVPVRPRAWRGCNTVAGATPLQVGPIEPAAA